MGHRALMETLRPSRTSSTIEHGRQSDFRFWISDCKLVGARCNFNSGLLMVFQSWEVGLWAITEYQSRKISSLWEF